MVRDSRVSRALDALLDKLFREGRITPTEAAKVRRITEAKIREVVRETQSEEVRMLKARNESLEFENKTLSDKSKLDDRTALMSGPHFHKIYLPEVIRQFAGGHNRQDEELRHWSALMVLDIQKFKDFNDVHGHTVGNSVIIRFAQVMKQLVRLASPIAPGDVVVRWGGDEFVVFMPLLDSMHNIYEKCMKIMDVLNRKVDWTDFGIPAIEDEPPVMNIGVACVDSRTLILSEPAKGSPVWKYMNRIDLPAGFKLAGTSDEDLTQLVETEEPEPISLEQAIGLRWFDFGDKLMYTQKRMRSEEPVIRYYAYKPDQGDYLELTDDEVSRNAKPLLKPKGTK